jgi:Uma2 family endonuclease
VPRGLPFESGDRLDQETFHRLYLTVPTGVKAELIGGIVYVASPTSSRHGRPHIRIAQWAANYADATPGTDALDNTTTILGPESEPQPDVCLRIDPDCGGQTTDNDKGYVVGACELVAEVAVSSANIDLHAKKRDYETAGVREYVVALVDDRRVVWYVRGRRGFAEMKPGGDGVYRSRTFPGLWLNPVALFERSARGVTKTLHAGLASPEHAAFVAKLEARAKKRKSK